jgi:hypothetical protein
VQRARLVRTLGLLLIFGLVSVGGGCGPGTPTPADTQEAESIGKDHRGRHEQLKAEAKKAQAAANRFEGRGKRHMGQ